MIFSPTLLLSQKICNTKKIVTPTVILDPLIKNDRDLFELQQKRATHCTGKTPSVRGESLTATGKILPEAAEITLKQEKEVQQQAELLLQWEKVLL